MLKIKLAAGIAAAALMTTAALAQTTAPAAGQPAAPAQQTQAQSSSMPGGGQFMTTMPANMMRGSKLVGVDVYGSDNQKIGDVDELILDQQGKIHAVVVGIGGFLGIGQKDVAIPYDQIQWMSSEEARTAAGTQPAGSTTTAGGVTTPSAPATTGSTGAGGTMGTAGTGGAAGTTTAASDGTPARAMVKMSKADLQNAPEFRYAANTAATGAGGAAGTSPPATTTRPGTAPQQ